LIFLTFRHDYAIEFHGEAVREESLICPTMRDNGGQVNITVKDQKDCIGNEMPVEKEWNIVTYVAAGDLIDLRNPE